MDSIYNLILNAGYVFSHQICDMSFYHKNGGYGYKNGLTIVVLSNNLLESTVMFTIIKTTIIEERYLKDVYYDYSFSKQPTTNDYEQIKKMLNEY